MPSEGFSYHWTPLLLVIRGEREAHSLGFRFVWRQNFLEEEYKKTMKAIGMNISRTLKKPSAVYLPPLLS